MANKKFALAKLSVVPVRVTPSDTSELDTCLLFGECAEIVEEKGNWMKIIGLFDNYGGWVDRKQLSLVSVPPASDKVTIASSLFAWAQNNEKRILIPRGAVLPNFDGQSFWLNDSSFNYFGDVYPMGEPINPDRAITLAKEYLGIPYLWGGRSPFGIDCSGFIQIILRLCGIDLPRNASQQVLAGENIDFKDRKPGDLVFFASNGKVFHVGLLVGPDEIIHASGEVRIDKITINGIFHGEKSSYSDNIFAVRRFFASS